jgi:hypothetical protein
MTARSLITANGSRVYLKETEPLSFSSPKKKVKERKIVPNRPMALQALLDAIYELWPEPFADVEEKVASLLSDHLMEVLKKIRSEEKLEETSQAERYFSENPEALKKFYHKVFPDREKETSHYVKHSEVTEKVIAVETEVKSVSEPVTRVTSAQPGDPADLSSPKSQPEENIVSSPPKGRVISLIRQNVPATTVSKDLSESDNI